MDDTEKYTRIIDPWFLKALNKISVTLTLGRLMLISSQNII
jgi:hypothetical protein